MRPIVLQHYKQSFRWYSHTPQSFKLAKREGKLVLVDLDAEWCFWCRKMEQETYYHPEVKAYILKHFIPIRVDADREPELKARYLKRGFPGYAILTPDRDILFRGSGFLIAEDFLDLLRDVRSGQLRETMTWEDEMALRRELEMEEKVGDTDLSGVPEALVQELKQRFDPEHGGFRTTGYAGEEAAKYPLARTLVFLLTYAHRNQDTSLHGIIRASLDAILEHLWDERRGGFFRYAEQPDWSVPHTEKVLRTQVRMLHTLALAYRRFQASLYQSWYLKTRDYLFQRLYNNVQGHFYGFEKAHAGGVSPTVFTDQAGEAICTFFAVSKLTGDPTLAAAAHNALNFLTTELYLPGWGLYHYFESGRAQGEASFEDYAWFVAAQTAAMAHRQEDQTPPLLSETLSKMSQRFQEPLEAPETLDPLWVLMRVHRLLFRLTGEEPFLQKARTLAQRLLPFLDTSPDYAFQDALHLEAKAGYALGIMELQEV